MMASKPDYFLPDRGASEWTEYPALQDDPWAAFEDAN